MTTTRTHDDDARDLRLLMDSALSDAAPAMTGLGDRVASTGRAVRRRRRVLVGSAAAVVALGAGWAAPRIASGPDGTGSVAADPGPSPMPATVTPTSDADSGPQGWWSMPASAMADRLSTLLPDGVTLTEYEHDNVDRAPDEPLEELLGYLQGELATAGGQRGAVNVMLLQPRPLPAPSETPGSGIEGSAETATADLSASSRISCPGNLADTATCQELVDESGHHYGRSSAWSDGDVTIFEVTVQSADGGLVYGAVANTADDKWGVGSHVTADQPPLTRGELRDLVEDDVWTSFEPAS